MTGIILAGGKSTRMGKDKAALPWATSDLLHAKIEQLRSVCQDIIVVSNMPRHIAGNDVRVISDIYQEMGPLGGIHAGLTHARYDYAFVTACDMPYFAPTAAQYLFTEAQGWDVTMPVQGNHYEPLFACYSTSCIPVAEMLLRNSVRRVIALFDFVRYKHVDQECFRPFDPALAIFSNINTQEDYRKARGNETATNQ